MIPDQKLASAHLSGDYRDGLESRVLAKTLNNRKAGRSSRLKRAIILASPNEPVRHLSEAY